MLLTALQTVTLLVFDYSSHFFVQLNSGQTGGPVGVDANVLPVWKSGITGRGVVISVLDDGNVS